MSEVNEKKLLTDDINEISQDNNNSKSFISQFRELDLISGSRTCYELTLMTPIYALLFVNIVLTLSLIPNTIPIIRTTEFNNLKTTCLTDYEIISKLLTMTIKHHEYGDSSKRKQLYRSMRGNC